MPPITEPAPTVPRQPSPLRIIGYIVAGLTMLNVVLFASSLLMRHGYENEVILLWGIVLGLSVQYLKKKHPGLAGIGSVMTKITIAIYVLSGLLYVATKILAA